MNIVNIDLLAVYNAQINYFRRMNILHKHRKTDKTQQRSKGKSKDRMVQMRSSYIGSVKHI